MTETRTVLIIEDGDEYRDNLARFVPGPRYLQAHNAAEALRLLKEESVDLIYLDMRFDRIPRADLVGDHARVTREQNGDAERAWRYMEVHQGLFILDELRRAGFGAMPVILAYDFSREEKRYEALRALYPNLRWVPDAVTPAEIQALINES
ncbi:MAG: hypothetical protein M5R36_01390 [Deltaproteobacteria bacterium]|nr:hypothetical protein [Deltaproteobacteria bacterium]